MNWPLLTLVAAGLAAGSAFALPVTLRYKAPDAKRVTVAGTFSRWNDLEMTKGADGTWTASLDLDPGAYQYKFIVDGRWIPDPNAGPPVPPDGNSALWVAPDANTPIPKRGDGQIAAFAVKHAAADLLRIDNTHARFSVHTAANDVDSVSMAVWPTPRPDDTTAPYREQPALTRIASDGATETWSVTLPVAGRMDYAFFLRDGQANWILGAAGLQPGAKPYTPFTADMDSLSLLETPAWVKDAVWYQVFPERFRDGDPSNDRKPPVGVPDWNTPLAGAGGNPNSHYWGGDLKGIREKLPYIKSLGATAIYLNPIFEGPDTHKYATTDYLKVDPDFGTEKDLKALCDEAHKRGMKVILDGVFNHTSVYNPWFQDILKNQEKSRYASWYHIKSFPVLDPTRNYTGADERNIPYEGWAGLKWMPRLNPADPECEKALLNVATYWIKRCGIDGWRLDVAEEVPHEYWKKFRTAVKGAKKDAVIIGEIWFNAAPWLRGDEFDSVMNYRFRGAVLDFFARGTSDAAKFADSLQAISAGYPPQATLALYNLLGSHDVPRLLQEASGDTRRAELATLFQMTWPGSPAVYYGDEIGMSGGTDPWDRAPMVWDESRWDTNLRKTFARAIALRHDNAALRSLDTCTLEAGQGSSVVAFLRGPEGEQQSLITVFNASAKEQIATVRLQTISDASVWKDLWNGGKLAAADGQIRITLPAYGAAVLRRAR